MRAYEQLFKPLLFLLDPETAHHLALNWLGRASSSKLTLRALTRRLAPPARPRTVFGVTFGNPIGLAAGFDKNGVALPAWAALGFGFVEIGTVTARPQSGNPRPRIFRYPAERALINRLGFNNDGADMVANRLRQLRESGRWPSIPVGINIGKSKLTPLEEAAADYLHSFRRLRNFADYVVLNVSSPNTPGLRSLQERESLSVLLRDIADENRTNKPIVVKIAPDMSDEQLADVLATCDEFRVSAIIATNTTTDHSALPSGRDQTGGLSGEPLRARSTSLIKSIATKTNIPIIGCGGIFDAASAREKIAAGASLLQLYTGFVYRGPGIIREILEGLSI
jgi:dihydroorotate dehydrogenase